MSGEATVVLKGGSKKPKLFVVWKEKNWVFNLERKQVLGRPSNHYMPDLQLPVSFVSREHGLFYTENGMTTYANRSKTNGTYYNDILMEGMSSKLLRDGDVLRIHMKNDSTHKSDVLMIYSSSYADDLTWKTIDLMKDAKSVSIGREGGDGQFSDQSVSRKHATFMYTPVGWAVVDHNSVNGVYVNNRRVDEQEFLMPMDVIRIAGYHFIFTGSKLIYQTDRGISAGTRSRRMQQPNQRKLGPSLSIYIEKREVWKKFRKKKLLSNIRLNIPGNSLVLILGGSGAGKTTFIQAVMGYEKASGEILYKGRNLYREYRKMQYEIGYVPQPNLLRESDSTYKTLENALNKKLKVSSKYEKEQLVMNALRLFGLTNQRDTVVSQLSGGEKKRLSTACEYITGPSLFFLDEPDSGLDAASSEQLMKELRHVANEGKIILVISHSPNRVSQYFDQVIVLAKGQQDNIGHLAFSGTPAEAVQFFKTKDLESIVKRINSVEEGGEGKSDYYINKFEQMRQNGRKR